MTRVFVPGDATACALGADAVAAAIAEQAQARGLDIELVRNGSRGLFWLEPLVEVETAAGRVAYGPVTPAAVPSLFDGGFNSSRPTRDYDVGPDGRFVAVGYIVNPLNIEMFAERIIEMLQDKEKAARMGEAGYQRVADKCSIQQQGQKMLALLQAAGTCK